MVGSPVALLCLADGADLTQEVALKTPRLFGWSVGCIVTEKAQTHCGLYRGAGELRNDGFCH